MSGNKLVYKEIAMLDFTLLDEQFASTCSPDNCSPDYQSVPWCGPEDSQDPNDDR